MSDTPSAPPRHQYEAFLRQLPADWEQKEITEVGAVVGGGTPSRTIPSFSRGSIPWVTPGEVSSETAKLLQGFLAAFDKASGAATWNKSPRPWRLARP